MTAATTTLQSSVDITVQPPVPVPTIRLALMAFLVLGAGATLTAGLDLMESKHCQGALEAQISVVRAERSAQISQVHVTPGAVVAVGQPLITVLDPNVVERIATLEQQLTEAKAEVERSRAEAAVDLEWRRRELKAAEFDAQLRAAELLQSQFQKQVEHVAWQDYLKRLNPVTTLVSLKAEAGSIIFDKSLPDEERLRALVAQDAAATTVEAISVQLQICEKRLIDLKELDKDLVQLIQKAHGVEVAKAKVQRIEFELSDLTAKKQGVTILSENYGTVSDLNLKAGDIVTAGQKLLDLVDQDRRYLLASIPSKDISQVSKGSKVELIFPGNQIRQGTVVDIPLRAESVVASSVHDVPIDVRVEASGREWPDLPLGTRVRVNFGRKL